MEIPVVVIVSFCFLCGIVRFARLRFSKDENVVFTRKASARLSDAELQLHRILYDVRKMRILRSWAALLSYWLVGVEVLILASNWAYRDLFFWSSWGLLALGVVGYVVLLIRWVRRTPDEQTRYMQEQGIGVEQLSEWAEASKRSSQTVAQQQMSSLLKSSLWALPLAAATWLLLVGLFPELAFGPDALVPWYSQLGCVFVLFLLYLFLFDGFFRRLRK